jgi:hypothetical protein
MNITGNGIKYTAFDINANTGEVKMGQPSTNSSAKPQSTQSCYCDDPRCNNPNCDDCGDITPIQSGIGHIGNSKNSRVTLDLQNNHVLKNANSGGTIGVLGDLENANVNITCKDNIVMGMDPNATLADQMAMLSQIMATKNKK